MIQVWRELSKGQTDTNHCARSGRIIQGMSSTITLQPEAASHPARAGDYCVVQFKLIACISMQLYLGVPLQCHRGKTCPRSHTPDDGREQLRHPWIKQRVILYTSGVGKSKPPVEKHFWRGSCALMRSLRFAEDFSGNRPSSLSTSAKEIRPSCKSSDARCSAGESDGPVVVIITEEGTSNVSQTWLAATFHS